VRPNIIVFLTDDQPYHTVDYMPTVKNELMAKGVTFENGFVTTPLCCPSRVSILTASTSTITASIRTAGRGRRPKIRCPHLARCFLARCRLPHGYFGKYLNGYEDLEPGASSRLGGRIGGLPRQQDQSGRRYREPAVLL